MAKGDIYPSEKRSFQDVITGITVHQWTNYRCHSNHLYFTHWPYYAGGRKMVFHSDRENARNLFGFDLQTGEIQQLTGFGPKDEGVGAFRACVNPVKDEAYFHSDRAVWSVNLLNLSERRIFELPPDTQVQMPNCGADGKYVYFTIAPDMSKIFHSDPRSGQPNNREICEMHPHCKVVRVPTSGGDMEVLWEGDHWIGHINTSLEMPDILTFCYEGPWRMIDQRIWGLNVETKEVWPLRPQDDGAMIGHEYWFSDGVTVGYHGRISKEPGAPILWGYTDYEGKEFKDYVIPRGCMHYHSLGADLLVGDGVIQDPYLMLWKLNGEGFDGRLLCRHLGSFHCQQVHVHPEMTPDGKGIIFTSDMGPYGNIYYIEIPEFESLPEA